MKKTFIVAELSDASFDPVSVKLLRPLIVKDSELNFPGGSFSVTFDKTRVQELPCFLLLYLTCMYIFQAQQFVVEQRPGWL